MGFAIDAPKCAQVSMNVCDFRSTGLERVYAEVEKLARAAGVEILESELVGLAPRAALPAGAADRIRLRGFDPKKQIIEELL
jgi:glutamate formiminotransferase